MPFHVRCRYCRTLLFAAAENLGDREAAAVCAHLQTCYPNLERVPRTIGELLPHLSVATAPQRPSLEPPRHAPHALPHVAQAILIVGDDGAERERLRARLDDEGFAVAVVPDAFDVLRALHAGVAPRAIVLDDAARGATLASWLAHHPAYRHIPVLAVGAAAGAPPPGIREVLAAPLDPEALLGALLRSGVRR